MKKHGTKLAIVAMIFVVAIIGAILFTVINSTNTLVSDLLHSQSKTANLSFVNTLQGYQDDALERAEMLAGSNEVVEAVINRDEDALKAALANFSTDMDLVTLCDAEGTVLVRTHSDTKGDSVISQKAISVALSTGKGIKTIERGTVIGLSTRGSAAILDEAGNIIAALTCGHDLSQEKYVDNVKKQSNCEATFFAGDERMNTTLLNESGGRAVGTKASDAVIKAVIQNAQDYETQIDLFGHTYSAYYSPVIVDSEVIGMLFTGVSIDDTLNQERNMVVMIIIAAIMLAVAVMITMVLIKWTTNKVHWYESMLDSIPFPISVTDMNMNWTFINNPVEQMLGVKRSDMLGKKCSNWGAGICNTDNCGINCLRNDKKVTYFSQAGSDFQVNISYLHNASGKEMGHIEIVQDISKTLKTQKEQEELLEKISSVSTTFINGSKEIADGAGVLAQGSMEQTAAIEELSGSVSDIAQKTKDNADMAAKAADLANTIMRSAEKGNQQMNQMMNAVKDINTASHNISKVISVIDSIAFQTNILALNAAVEAARAGQHGKGFAVVAEEVRNLAAKSAEAAKDTGGLIANSMEKAEYGARIAEETASSFVEIAAGINESNKLVSEIAKSSEEQSKGIAQINLGIDQVAHVVQQNSATAQESAATSVELSEHASILEGLITQYEHKDDIKLLN